MLDDIGRPDLALHDRRVLPLLGKSFAAHGLLLALGGGLILMLHGMLLAFPAMSSKSAVDVVVGTLFLAVPINLLALVTYLFIRMVVYEKPKRPTLQLCRNLIAVLSNRQSWIMALPMYLSFFSFTYVFCLIKANITVFRPFAWDETFDHWDVVLHFGRRPWEWLQPLLGYPPITLFLNLNYNVWFMVMVGFWFYYAFLARPGEERTRFFLSFMLTWMIGGGLFATLLSSAGPCFYGAGRLGLSPDPYAPLMAYLRDANEIVPIGALATQDLLWELLEIKSAFGGVSAMPSMHNATVLLFLLTSRNWPAWVRRLLLVHFILIFAGSIHLGWHYAVDAYVAWAIALAVWWATGPVARWWEARPVSRDFREALASDQTN